MEKVRRRTLLAWGGTTVAGSMAALAVLLAVAPADSVLVLAVALALLCVNRVALTCTLQPLAATGETGRPGRRPARRGHMPLKH